MQCHGGQHDHDRHQGHHGSDPGPNWSKIGMWAAGLGALAVLAYWLYRNGNGNLLAYGLLLLCPLMHVFMMGGHGHGHGHGHQSARRNARDDADT